MYKKIGDMKHTDFIAAIDLGTSCVVGIVGVKNPEGTLSIIAHEVENSAACIKRGCVHNVEGVANKVKGLIQKLENKLQGVKIGKVYVGVGGMSLRSVDHTVSRDLGEADIVSKEVIDALYKECRQYRPDMQDVLAVVSPTYYVDNRLVENPVGTLGSRIEARYKLIVSRPDFRSNIINSINKRANLEIAGILVSPLAMADVILSDDEKKLGCALIGFGAGVTTLTVYKGGNLVNLLVIPLGSDLITKDIMSLHILEAEAERIKCAYGSAMIGKENDTRIQVNSVDGVGLREIALEKLNMIVEARTRELLENVYAHLDETRIQNDLGAGVVITGGGSALKNLKEAIQGRLKVNVRCSALREGVVSSEGINPVDPRYSVAIGLLMQGTENCAKPIPKEPSVPTNLFGDQLPPVEQAGFKGKQPPAAKNPGRKEKKEDWRDKIKRVGEYLFKEENEE